MPGVEREQKHGLSESSPRTGLGNAAWAGAVLIRFAWDYVSLGAASEITRWNAAPAFQSLFHWTSTLNVVLLKWKSITLSAPWILNGTKPQAGSLELFLPLCHIHVWLYSLLISSSAPFPYSLHRAFRVGDSARGSQDSAPGPGCGTLNSWGSQANPDRIFHVNARNSLLGSLWPALGSYSSRLSVCFPPYECCSYVFPVYVLINLISFYLMS